RTRGRRSAGRSPGPRAGPAGGPGRPWRAARDWRPRGARAGRGGRPVRGSFLVRGRGPVVGLDDRVAGVDGEPVQALDATPGPGDFHAVDRRVVPAAEVE